MSRTLQVITTTMRKEDLGALVSGMLVQNNYEWVNEHNYWQRGDGVWVAPQYIAYEARDGAVLIEGFIRAGFIPGTGAEKNLKGYYGIIIKNMVRGMMERILAEIRKYDVNATQVQWEHVKESTLNQSMHPANAPQAAPAGTYKPPVVGSSAGASTAGAPVAPAPMAGQAGQPLANYASPVQANAPAAGQAGQKNTAGNDVPPVQAAATVAAGAAVVTMAGQAGQGDPVVGGGYTPPMRTVADNAAVEPVAMGQTADGAAAPEHDFMAGIRQVNMDDIPQVRMDDLPPLQVVDPQAAPQDLYEGAQGQQGQNAQYMPPQGQYAPPQGRYVPPQGQYMPPQGQYAPPQGQYAQQQGQYVPPQGQYMPPQGQYAPQQGRYAPQQGRYVSPQGQYVPPQQLYVPPQGRYSPQASRGAGGLIAGWIFFVVALMMLFSTVVTAIDSYLDNAAGIAFFGIFFSLVPVICGAVVRKWNKEGGQALMIAGLVELGLLVLFVVLGILDILYLL